MTTTFRSGPVGALMDEYERAMRDLIGIIASISDEQFELVRDADTDDEDCRSVETIVRHVIRSGYGYARLIRAAWGIECTEHPIEPVVRSDAAARLNAMLHYMVETLEGRWEISGEEADAMRIQSRWGPVFTFEQLFEHAIVHVLRHRRQIERFLSGTRPITHPG